METSYDDKEREFLLTMQRIKEELKAIDYIVQANHIRINEILDEESEKFDVIMNKNKRSILFIDQKKEDGSKESFIIHQDQNFNLYKIIMSSNFR